MQDNRMSATLNEDGSFSASDEAAYQHLRSRIVGLVNELHLHNNRPARGLRTQAFPASRYATTRPYL